MLGFVVGILLGIQLGSVGMTKNQDNIELETVTKMTAKCDINGGIDSITHGYDVTCKNGAKFPFKE